MKKLLLVCVIFAFSLVFANIDSVFASVQTPDTLNFKYWFWYSLIIEWDGQPTGILSVECHTQSTDGTVPYTVLHLDRWYPGGNNMWKVDYPFLGHEWLMNCAAYQNGVLYTSAGMNMDFSDVGEWLYLPLVRSPFYLELERK